MPEGPELYLAGRFIKKVCKGRLFGKICKSEISKNPPVVTPFNKFTIDSCSRGKEVKLILTDAESIRSETEIKNSVAPSTLEILFTFGLAGKFDFCRPDELQKHSHLCFYTADGGPDMVLSFVDYMRFGKWTVNAPFSKDRGPCVLFDYSNFRTNVLENVESSVFNKPICEVLLNQKYFNGIGNYLRAEILFRHGTPPFVSARSVLEPLAAEEVKVSADVKVKSEKPDILQLCNIVAMEVVNLEGDGYDLQDRADETKAFNAWLQCYYQEGMKNMADHNKRTIWYHGPAGPLAPKEVKTRARKTGKKKKKETESSDSNDCKNEETIEEKSSKPRRSRKKAVQNSGVNEFSEIETSQDKKPSRKRTVAGTQAQQEPPKKLTKRKKEPASSLLHSDSTEVSDLKSDILMDSQHVTRGRLKSILCKGDNSKGRLKSVQSKGGKPVKSPAARTKARARISSHKLKSEPVAAKSRRSKSKSRWRMCLSL